MRSTIFVQPPMSLTSSYLNVRQFDPANQKTIIDLQNESAKGKRKRNDADEDEEDEDEDSDDLDVDVSLDGEDDEDDDMQVDDHTQFVPMPGIGDLKAKLHAKIESLRNRNRPAYNAYGKDRLLEERRNQRAAMRERRRKEVRERKAKEQEGKTKKAAREKQQGDKVQAAVQTRPTKVCLNFVACAMC